MGWVSYLHMNMNMIETNGKYICKGSVGSTTMFSTHTSKRVMYTGKLVKSLTSVGTLHVSTLMLEPSITVPAKKFLKENTVLNNTWDGILNILSAT